MFEQTFVAEGANDKKRYSVFVGLLLEVAALVLLIIVPLIYTQVLPQARLRSVFAAPRPAAPALPKAPVANVRTVTPERRLFQITPISPLPPRAERRAELASAAPPDTVIGAPVGTDTALMGATSDSMEQIKLPAPPPRTPAAHQPMSKVVRASDIQASLLIYKVQPAYPALARQIRVQGVVEFTAVISKTGTIENLQLVRGHPMLIAAARDAILQWRYKPTLLNGEPVEVITNIVVNFSLNEP